MKRIVFAACWILGFAMISSAQSSFFFPHIANGVTGTGAGAVKWVTTIYLTNPTSSTTATGTLTFYQRNTASVSAAGTIAAPIGFVDESGVLTATGTINFSLAGGQTKKYVSTAATALITGFVGVSTQLGIVSGTAVFSEYNAAGGLIASAGVPQSSATGRQAIFVDTQSGDNIGVAYANPGTATATVTLTLLNSAAQQVATTNQSLGPGNQVPIFTSQLFTGAAPVAGTMVINSTAPLAAIALKFDPTFQIFSTLPPVTLSSLFNPAIKWLEERTGMSPFTSVARLLGAFQVRI